MQKTEVKAKEVGIVRFRIVGPLHKLTLSIESPQTPVWVMALTTDGYDAYLSGMIKPPEREEKGILDAFLIMVRQAGNVLCSTPPRHAYAATINLEGKVGWWYLLIGNQSEKDVSVSYATWPQH